jgi:hypothetical protein
MLSSRKIEIYFRRKAPNKAVAQKTRANKFVYIRITLHNKLGGARNYLSAAGTQLPKASYKRHIELNSAAATAVLAYSLALSYFFPPRRRQLDKILR